MKFYFIAYFFALVTKQIINSNMAFSFPVKRED